MGRGRSSLPSELREDGERLATWALQGPLHLHVPSGPSLCSLRERLTPLWTRSAAAPFTTWGWAAPQTCRAQASRTLTSLPIIFATSVWPGKRWSSAWPGSAPRLPGQTHAREAPEPGDVATRCHPAHPPTHPTPASQRPPCSQLKARDLSSQPQVPWICGNWLPDGLVTTGLRPHPTPTPQRQVSVEQISHTWAAAEALTRQGGGAGEALSP